jgi:hypothetical protein
MCYSLITVDIGVESLLEILQRSDIRTHGYTSAAKEVSGVFTGINFIENSASTTQTPFGYYDVVVAWLIYTSEAVTDDTLYLEMPYVFEMRNVVGGVATNYLTSQMAEKPSLHARWTRPVEKNSRPPLHFR